MEFFGHSAPPCSALLLVETREAVAHIALADAGQLQAPRHVQVAVRQDPAVRHLFDGICVCGERVSSRSLVLAIGGASGLAEQGAARGDRQAAGGW